MHFAPLRKTLREAALAVFFLISFSILKYFPGLTMIKEGWIIATSIFLLTFYVADRLAKGTRISQLEGYILILLLWAPTSSVIQSYSEFEQPLIYGLLAQRNIMLAISAIILLYLLRHKQITLPDVEQALVKLAWGCLTLFTLVTWTFDPIQFVDAGKGFVGGSNIGEAAFNFNSIFIVFGFYYHISNAFWQAKTKQILLAIPFLLFLIFVDGGRSLLLSVFGTVIFFLYRWISFSRLVRMIPRILLLAMIFFAVILFSKQEYMIGLIDKFNDAFIVVLTAKETMDVSANARIQEVLIAKPYIAARWAFGNGNLSNQWQGGFQSRLGYFYPSDIGIIGMVFLFGIFGVLLFSFQFLFAVRYANRLPKNGGEHGALICATKGFLLYYALHSLVTGKFVHSVEIGLLFIVILYWASLTAKKTNTVVITNSISTDVAQ